MLPGRTDKSLQGTLDWALGRMRGKGYGIGSKVSLSVDPKLAIMGYAKNEGGVHKIVISEWALDSEMLGGLVLHELAHIYFMEQDASTHDSKILEEVLQEMKERDGLRAREVEYLIDAFNHLQNIIVDDVVFAVMEEKELPFVKKFFSEWISERRSGDPVLDASLLCRNAFAIASLKRRRLFGERDEMGYRNSAFISANTEFEEDFEWLERFLEGASAKWNESQFRDSLDRYFDRLVALMRVSAKLDDLR